MELEETPNHEVISYNVVMGYLSFYRVCGISDKRSSCAINVFCRNFYSSEKVYSFLRNPVLHFGQAAILRDKTMSFGLISLPILIPLYFLISSSLVKMQFGQWLNFQCRNVRKSRAVSR